MKIFTTLLIIIIATGSISAQTIKGIIIDKETKQPVDYANIILQNRADSSYVDGTISDINGFFSINSKDAKNQFVLITRLDYKDYIISSISNSDTIWVELAPNIIEMDEITIKATRPISKMTASGLQTAVANTLLSEMGTGDDVLKRIPMVTGDKGVYEVFGRGNAKIYINNREVRDPQEIDNLNSKEIQSIEVISNPGSRYDATVAAVILIKTIKKQGDGFSFNARSSFYTWKNQDYIEQLNTNYRIGGLDIFANLYYSDMTGFQRGDLEQITTVDTLWKQIGTIDGQFNSNRLNGTVGANYEINENHYIGFRYDIKTSPNHNIESFTTINDVYADGVLFDQWNNKEYKDKSRKPGSQANIYYTGKVEKLTINFNADYLDSEESYKAINTEYSKEQGDRAIYSTNNTKNELWAAKLQLSYPIWKGELMAGSEYTNIARYDAYINDQMPDFSSKINVDEQNLALFAEYQVSTKIGNFSAGVRYEDANYNYLVNGKKDDDKSRRYSQWFPNISYSNNFGALKLQLAYTSKIVRPTYSQLSNGMFYGNKLTIQTGNPYLKPTRKQSVSLMAIWKIIQAQVSYTHETDGIYQWIDRYEKDPKVSLINYKNIANLPSLTANIVVSPIIGVWRPQISAGILKHWLDYDSYGIKENMSKPLFFASMDNVFNLPNNWIVNVDANFTSKGNYPVAVYKYKEQILVGAGISKSFFNKSLQIKLAISDIFNQTTASKVIIPQTELLNLYHFDNREISLTLRYYFNSAKNKYKGTSAGQDAMNRL